MIFLVAGASPSWQEDGREDATFSPYRSHGPGFTPQTPAQLRASVYTVWNLLDRNIEVARNKDKPRNPYGYMRPAQLEAYSALVRSSTRPRTYCETGFNAGHGTAAMLLSSPHLIAHTFDMFKGQYSRKAKDLLKMFFGKRLQVHVGDSHTTLGQVAALGNVTCDIILVDGDHSLAGSRKDMEDFERLAACGATLLIDDLNEGPGGALEALKSDGTVRETSRRVFNKSRGDSAQYCVRSKYLVAGEYSPGFCPDWWGWAMATYSRKGCDT